MRNFKRLLPKYLEGHLFPVEPTDAIADTMHDFNQLKDIDELLARQDKLNRELYELIIQDYLTDNGGVDFSKLGIQDRLDYDYAKNVMIPQLGMTYREFGDYPGRLLVKNKDGKEMWWSAGNNPGFINAWANGNLNLDLNPTGASVSADTRTPELAELERQLGLAEYEWQQLKELERQGNKVAAAMAMAVPLVAAQQTPIGPYIDAAFFGAGAGGLATQKSPIGLNAETALNVLYMMPAALRGVQALRGASTAAKIDDAMQVMREGDYPLLRSPEFNAAKAGGFGLDYGYTPMKMKTPNLRSIPSEFAPIKGIGGERVGAGLNYPRTSAVTETLPPSRLTYPSYEDFYPTHYDNFKIGTLTDANLPRYTDQINYNIVPIPIRKDK